MMTSKVKLKLSVWIALREAMRRYLNFGEDKPNRTLPVKTLLQAWTGLGTKTEYKDAISGGWMQWVRVPPPRCKGWLQLTEKGAKVVQKWIDDGYTMNPGFEDAYNWYYTVNENNQPPPNEVEV